MIDLSFRRIFFSFYAYVGIFCTVNMQTSIIIIDKYLFSAVYLVDLCTFFNIRLTNKKGRKNIDSHICADRTQNQLKSQICNLNPTSFSCL